MTRSDHHIILVSIFFRFIGFCMNDSHSQTLAKGKG